MKNLIGNHSKHTPYTKYYLREYYITDDTNFLNQIDCRGY